MIKLSVAVVKYDQKLIELGFVLQMFIEGDNDVVDLLDDPSNLSGKNRLRVHNRHKNSNETIPTTKLLLVIPELLVDISGAKIVYRPQHMIYETSKFDDMF